MKERAKSDTPAWYRPAKGGKSSLELMKPGYDPRRNGVGMRVRAVRITTPSGEEMTLTELAKAGTWEAVETLRACLGDGEQEMLTRVRAAGYLLSLGWGSAPREATLRMVNEGTLAGMSNAELVALVLKALPAAQKQLSEVIDVESESDGA
jgi:hypothetical protein